MGLIPTFIERLEQTGVIIPRDMFSNDPKVNATGPAKPAAKVNPMPTPMPTLKKTGTEGGGNSGTPSGGTPS